MLEKHLEPWLAEHEGYILAKINTDTNRELAGNYQIKSIPTMMIFVNNQQIVWDQDGAKQDRVIGLNPNVIDFIKDIARDLIETHG